VLVWIHGGGFTTGSASMPIYDGARLARRGDVVVVGVNYRLGALGYLALPCLADGGDVAGNYGLLDQIAALRWVREHAHVFGGDPDRVTVVGESAGAMSIGALLGCPAAHGLFQRAILQSGAASNVLEPEEAVRVGETFAKELGVAAADAEALRATPPEQLLVAQQRSIDALARELPHQLAFEPVVDGRTLPRRPLDTVRDGGAPAIPLLIGTNRDEWKLYSFGDPKVGSLDRDGLLRRCGRNLPGSDSRGRPHAEIVVEAYERARRDRASTLPGELWFAIQSDRWFRVPAIRLAEHHAARGAEVYKYLFTWATPVLGGALGSCHALEVPFVFGCVRDHPIDRILGDHPAIDTLSERMQDAWLAFARHGDPSCDALPVWPAYQPDQPTSMCLGRECRTEKAPFQRELRFWNALALG
jgi:para-nitrobenzyl esterase